MRRGGWILGPAMALCALPVAQGCGIFASGECTDLAICPDQSGTEGGSVDVSPMNSDGSSGVDVQLDTLVAPDGPLPDGTCNMGIEDCTNGKDDNCNGLIDCADPVCNAGYTCTDAPPAGWSGPVSDWEAPSGSPPSCLGAYATTAVDGNGTLSASPATCSCNPCGGATGQTCQSDSAYIYQDGTCGTLLANDGLPSPFFCVNFGSCPSCTSVKVPTFAPDNGSCSTSTNQTLPPWSWGLTARTCSYSGNTDTPGGCMPSAQCVAKPSSPFSGPCIYQSGDQMCPSDYPTKHLYYSGATEGRSCTTCTCGFPSGGTCTGSIDLYNGGSCSGTKLASLALGPSCQTVTGGGWSWQATSFTITTPGSCSISSGGTAQGSVTPTGPTTVCCK